MLKFVNVPFPINATPAVSVPTQKFVWLSSNKTDDATAAKSGSVVVVENGKAVAIEPHQTMERSQPEITVLGLNHGNDFTVRQALLFVPGI